MGIGDKSEAHHVHHVLGRHIKLLVLARFAMVGGEIKEWWIKSRECSILMVILVEGMPIKNESEKQGTMGYTWYDGGSPP